MPENDSGGALSAMCDRPAFQGGIVMSGKLFAAFEMDIESGRKRAMKAAILAAKAMPLLLAQNWTLADLPRIARHGASRFTRER